MFRPRRSNLVKRLWRARAQDQSSDSEDLQVKNVIHAVLKRLKEKQLETLLQAVEGLGEEDTDCVLLSKGPLRLGRRTVEPQVLCCQIWRWPELEREYELKRLACCSSADDATSICCNPYHWSLLVRPDSPPPPYSRTVIERVSKQDEPLVGETVLESTETGMTPPQLRLTDESLTPGGTPGRGQYWCNLAYWEHRQRVGCLFTVCEPSVNVFQELPRGSGMCLHQLQTESQEEVVRRTREKIGFGIVLSKEGDGVWLYNRSLHAVFVNSPTLDIPHSPALIVIKVPPGYSIKIFDYKHSEILERTRDPQFLDGPYDPNAVRISFAKGWGPNYSRQFITSCPCWLEILLRVNR